MTESRPPLPPFTLETKKGHVTCYRKPRLEQSTREG